MDTTAEPRQSKFGVKIFKKSRGDFHDKDKTPF